MTDHHPDPPELLRDPAMVEGMTGGPAFPTGGLSASDKQEIDDASETIFVAAGATAVGAGLAGMGGLAPAAAGLGVFAGFLAVVSKVLSGIAADPPRPFAHTVKFSRRISLPPAMSDPVLERVGIASQYAITSFVTGNGYLDALERRAGAQNADDFSWAVAHHGVVMQCHGALAIDLAALAAAMNSAGTVLATSPYDSKLTQGSDALQTWVKMPGVDRAMRSHLRAAGLATPGIKDYP